MADAHRLEAGLDRVHAALLAANFNELPKIVEETERLLVGFQGLKDKATAERLRHKAQRNAQCLQAAARGLRAAQRRLVEMSGNATALATYNSLGKRAEIGVVPGNLTQRL